MEFSTRQNKLGRLVQKELGDIFQKNQRDWFGKTMVTVTVVRVSGDLSIAKVYLSMFPSKDAKHTIELLNYNVAAVRLELGNRIRHQVKNIPELRFFIDDSLDHIERIENLLKS